MQQKISIKMLPSEAADESTIKSMAAASCGRKTSDITGVQLLKRSIDARGKQVWVLLTLNVFINEPFQPYELTPFHFRDVSSSTKRVVIIGAGPAGLFAALSLIEKGIKPIILERGKDVRSRRRDLAQLNREGIINPDSNYCFGEGGAGTYSDGKLYTRSNKRGNINRILQLFVHFGAEENILFDAHPHIGTNKLPHIITSIRRRIVDCGGEFHFDKKVTAMIIKKDKIVSVTAGDDIFEADAFILATGHSARDIFWMLYDRKVIIEAKPFALGVRVEHPQDLIDTIQYGEHTVYKKGIIKRSEYLPPASYSLVHQVRNKGVFSFCMCPGGIIAPAGTSSGELVVNGWSPSKRNNPYANSGIVVQVEKEDVIKWKGIKHNDANDPLLFMKFQSLIEQRAFDAGGGKFVAPAQRMTDFISDKMSSTLPSCSYLPGIHSSPIKEILPPFINDRLKEAFRAFGKKMKGYLTENAVIVATESRTSSPVRIPRDPDTLHHPQIKNLYPCGEGAGYAGGIVSAAMDGERVAEALNV